MSKISIVLPVMNEVNNIEPISAAISSTIEALNHDYELLFVCDPSSDGTEDKIEELSIRNTHVRGIFLADRAGQTEAIRAGYDHANGDAIISMDADFQDPPELLTSMIQSWEQGSLIVHTKRGDRTSDTLFYRAFTGTGYRFLGWLTKGKVQHNVGDYRLIDRSILPLVLKFEDPNPFWRGITSMAGVKSSVIQYKRPVRRTGATKYHARIGSPAVALRGMASFSVKPLELLQSVGVISLIASAITLISITVLQVMNPSFPRGIPTLIALLALYFGVQFFSTAIIATYLIVIIEQTRRRPNYLKLPRERP